MVSVIALTFSGGHAFAVAGDAFNNVSAPDIEIIVEADARRTRTGQKAGEVAGDERLAAAAGAAGAGAHRGRRKAAIEKAGRPRHGVGRAAEPDRESAKR